MASPKLTVLRLNTELYNKLDILAKTKNTTVEIMLEKNASEIAKQLDTVVKTNVELWIEAALKKIKKLPKGAIFKSTDFLPEGATFKEKMDFGKQFLTVVENGNHYTNIIRKPRTTTQYVR